MPIVDRLFKSTAFRLHAVGSRIEGGVARRELRLAGVRNAERIPTHMTRRELRVLYELAKACPAGAHALEVGSYLGASSVHLCAGLAENGGHLFCVDTWRNETMPEGERDTLPEFRRNTAACRDRITPVRKRSDDLRAADVRLPLRLVFLDGDHGYEAVHHEVTMVTPWVERGGVLAFHDAVEFEGVARAVGGALASGDWQLVGHMDNLVWLRRVEWTAPRPAHV